MQPRAENSTRELNEGIAWEIAQSNPIRGEIMEPLIDLGPSKADPKPGLAFGPPKSLSRYMYVWLGFMPLST
ncbi:hypothetical protein Dda_3549 [Drechslerella dactyloides]|uniref:Uncharacterized protein n=1 Tax=Drechslerella dactyloides TaxID=74499 RepID=A0AAD6NL91_DREDA|nr:hypothetical protein Dda_3549 [Drechslerella dactyloides]